MVTPPAHLWLGRPPLRLSKWETTDTAAALLGGRDEEGVVSCLASRNLSISCFGYECFDSSYKVTVVVSPLHCTARLDRNCRCD